MKIGDTGEWLYKGEAARRLGISKRTLERYQERGLIKGYKLLNWFVLYRKEDVEALIERLQTQGREYPEEHEPSVNGNHQEGD